MAEFNDADQKLGTLKCENTVKVESSNDHINRNGSGVAQKKSKQEKRLLLKQDLLLMPLLSGCIFFEYLDRSQIGNARVMGMQKDLHLTSRQFYNCLMMFFLGYMVIELVAGLALRKYHPRYVIGFAAIVFGVAATCLSTAKSYATVMVLRVILGLAEAFANTAYLYISYWYKPEELALRTAGIYCMTPVAGATSGLIAYGVQHNLNGAQGYKSWQWLFIIEGVASIFFAFFPITLLPGLPDTVAEKGSLLFKHEDERRLISARMVEGQNSMAPNLRYHQILIAIKDPKLYLGSIVIGAQGIGIGAFSVFLPTFINEFGFSSVDTQLYSIIPYAFGLVSLMVFAYLADRYRCKAIGTAVCLSISITGFVILLSTTNRIALMAGACFVLAGSYPALAISVAWILSFHGGFTKRAVAVWFLQIFIQSESIIATQVYDGPPRFFKGHGIALGFYLLALGCVGVLYTMLRRANLARDRRAQQGDLHGAEDKTFEDLCDFHPDWRYTL